MNWSAIGEIIKVIGAAATGSAAAFASYIAYRGLEKWRAETVGKSRYDVAVATLTIFYRMEQILMEARGPFVLPHEMAPKEGIPDEVATDPNYAPEARLLEHQELFAKFRSARHEFAAVFGKVAAQPFDELWRDRLAVNHSVDFMLRNKEIGRSRRPEDRQLWEDEYRTAFRHPDPSKDKLAAHIAAQIEAIEATCRPVIAKQAPPAAKA